MAPYTAQTRKIACQDATSRMAPPRVGARMGATPETSISLDIIRAAAMPSDRSRTTARGMTMPAEPPRAAMARNTDSQNRSGARAQPSEARV